MKKRIGISFTRTHFQNYWNWITPDDLKDDLELIELSFEKNNIEDISSCYGYILTGGVDVHPALYDGMPEYENQPAAYQPDRDQFEKLIYEYSQEHQLPVLGICRGMQLINVLEGGKLVEDLGPDNERHKKDETDKEHIIFTANHSLLKNITGSHTGVTNSAHHQAIDPDALGENLKVNAYDEDDITIIEGMEFNDKTDKGFMLCVQWHPERMSDKEQNPFSQKIKERFLNEIRKVKK